MIHNYKNDLKLFYGTIKKLNVGKVKIFIIFIMMILSNILQLMIPLLFGNVINGIMKKSLNVIQLSLICMLLIFVISNILNYITSMMLIKLSYNLELSIKEDLFNSILRMSYSEFLKIDKGKLINNIENDATRISGLLGDTINIVMQIINICISFLFMIYISPVLIILLIATFPITSMMYMYSGKKVKIKEEEYIEKNDNMLLFLYDSLYGKRILNLFNASIKRGLLLKEKILEMNNLRVTKFKIQSISHILVSIFAFIINSLNILLATFLIFNNKLTLGMFTAFNDYADTFKNILASFSELNSTIQEISVSIRRINNILNYKTQEIELFLDKSLKNQVKKIEIKNLYYSTSHKKEIFNDINLSFSRGNIYIIKGESGIGKSTLFNILSNSTDNYNGKIFFDSVELNDINKYYFNSKIKYITQDNYIFSMSIRENISLYRNIDFLTIRQICKRLNIDEIIMSLPNGYDTIITKNGIDLSGGQRQRLAIARALVNNSDIYLFDEITLGIDKKNIKEILNIIEEISINSIILITSHENLDFKIPTIEYNITNKNLELNLT